MSSLAIQILKELAQEYLKPKVFMDLVEYSNKFRFLSNLNAEPGKYRTSRTKYIEEPMRRISEDDVHSVSLMFSSQTGKSEFLLSLFQYFAHQEPSTMMLIQPTEKSASAFSKERISKQIDSTPVLRQIFGEDHYKNRQNTVMWKEFPGGFLSLHGSNSPAGLASKPIRIIIGDEIDRWTDDAKGEGSPVEIASRRTLTYHNYKHIWVSTPVTKGESKIEELFLKGTQHIFHIQCVQCDEYFYPELKHLKWEETDTSTALLHCPCCGVGLNNVERLRGASKGIWIASNPEAKDYSFHTNAFVSPFTSLEFIAKEFIACDNIPAKLGPFYNTMLGLPYEDVGEILGDTQALIDRREDYTHDNIPNDVNILTLGADVQGDRIEAQVLGHTEAGQVYVVHTFIFPCDTSELESYDEFFSLAFAKTPYIRQDKIQLFIRSGLMDSGYNTKIVYAACNKHKKLNVFPSKGKEGYRPQVTLSKNLHKQQFYVVGIDIFKEYIFNSLAITNPSKSGYIHFSLDQNLEYFNQLTLSESRVITVDKHGRSYAHYEKRKSSGYANEMLDTFVYALAAFEIMKNVHKKNANYSIKLQKSEKTHEEDTEKTINIVSKPPEVLDKYSTWNNTKTNRANQKGYF